MNTEETEFILKTLDFRQEPFYYFKDRYAFMLLTWQCENANSLAALRNSRFGFLLQKPTVKQWMANLSGKSIPLLFWEAYWAYDTLQFTLSLDKWGGSDMRQFDGYYQTSRPGLNLVLQLNFSTDHDHLFYDQLKMRCNSDFQYCWHPVQQKSRNTLGWVRMDIDLDDGEVLIEEVQTDWLRNALKWQKKISELKGSTDGWHDIRLADNVGCGEKELLANYLNHVILAYGKVWDEALLAATLWFIRQQLGIQRVFFHTAKTQQKLKKFGWKNPPQSLYTKLPRRFGFAEAENLPGMLRRERRLKKLLRKEVPRFYQLELP